MSAADEGRTETATQKQRDKFRDDGSVPKSQELSTLASFLTGFVLLSSTGASMFLALGEMMIYGFSHLEYRLEGDLHRVNSSYFWQYFMLMLPLFTGLFLSVIVVSRFQFPFKVSWKAIKPKGKKLNPISNFKNVMISKKSMMEMVKFSTKITIMSLLAWTAIEPLTEEYASLFYFTPIQIGMIVWDYAVAIWIMIIAFMMVLGIGDYVWQKHQLEEQMKMTKTQIKDENKQSQGDPQTKMRQRRKAIELLHNLMRQGTKEADVVITNPTHFAVALKYTHGAMGAPKVVARGVDHMALHIRGIAKHHEIPIVENRPLARLLFYETELGSEIPDRLFKPVAEILAFIFKMRRAKVSA